MNMEKASGLITTDWISFKGQKDETGYCACGKARFPLSEIDRHGKFNVYIKKISENSCEIKVNAVFEKIAAYGDVVEKTPCFSTGKLEADIYKLIIEKLK
jgi:transcription elongation factor Elf1